MGRPGQTVARQGKSINRTLRFRFLNVLHFQKADLAICDLTITYERESAVDFTMPFMTLGELNASPISILRGIKTALSFYRHQHTLQQTDEAADKSLLFPVALFPGRLDVHGDGLFGSVTASLRACQVGSVIPFRGASSASQPKGHYGFVREDRAELDSCLMSSLLIPG